MPYRPFYQQHFVNICQHRFNRIPKSLYSCGHFVGLLLKVSLDHFVNAAARASRSRGNASGFFLADSILPVPQSLFVLIGFGCRKDGGNARIAVAFYFVVTLAIDRDLFGFVVSKRRH